MILERVIVIYTIVFILMMDLASAWARSEMYTKIRILTDVGKMDIPLEIYSSICFYLIPTDNIVKITKNLPITYLIDLKLKHMLKDTVYDDENVIERLDRIQNLLRLPIDRNKNRVIER